MCWHTDNPSWAVRDTLVKYLSLLNEDMEAIHNLLDGRGMIPVVHIQNIDPVSSEFLQRVSYAQMQTASGVSAMVRAAAFAQGMKFVIRRVLRRNDDLIAIVAGRHPLANPLFGFLRLVAAGCIDEVTAGFVEGIQKLERGLFVHPTQGF